MHAGMHCKPVAKRHHEFTPAFDATRRASSYAKIAMETEDVGATGAAGVGLSVMNTDVPDVTSVMETDS